MAPYTPGVGDGPRDEAMYDSTPAISTYVNGQSLDRNSSQESRLENASDIADLKAGLLLSPKHIPCGYLYDDKGSQLYEEITKLDEYYPFKAEKDLLNRHATEIVSSIPAGSILVELGCGTAEKTSVLLHALIARDGASNVHFLGIDVSMEALYMARTNVMKQCPQLSSKNIEMVCADYLEGLKQARARHPTAMLCVLWLGSSVGNLKPHEAVGFFQSVQESSGPNTQIFLCTDLWKDAKTLHAAYCDSQGVTEAFIKNGMTHALHAVGVGAQAAPACWLYDVVINPVDRRVEMWLVANEDVKGVCGSVDIHKGERILMEMSRKFTLQDIRQLAFQSNFYVQDTWRNAKYSMQMLVSTSEAMQRCWKATDALFDGISDWSVQPIDVRHPFGFYYGHLASFAKLKTMPRDEQSHMDEMYSRGIDPNMTDPTKCHSHPDVPPEWPAKPQVQDYAQKVRTHILEAFASGSVKTRDAYVALEHEWMHLETLAYMLTQEQRLSFEKSSASSKNAQSSLSTDSSSDDEMSAKRECVNGHAESQGNGVTNGVANGNTHANGDSNGGLNGHAHANGNSHSVTDSHTNGDGNSRSSNGHVPLQSASMIQVPAGDVTLGIDTDPSKNFAWDNEGPQQSPQHVSSFQMASCPISNAEYYKFAVDCRGYEQEEYWKAEDLTCLRKATKLCPATWTVQADGQVFVHRPGKSTPLARVMQQAVWVSLAEAQAFCKWAGGRVMTEGEYERAAEHTRYSDRVLDLEQDGWEWTSTPFAPLKGFEAMSEYPEYSTDFFDGCHYVVKGSSPYTHASLIRRSFRNYYQKEYPYVFAKFRMCKDAE